MTTTINQPDDRLSAIAHRFDALAYEAEAASVAGFATTHQRFMRAWMMRDLARMESLADTLAADIAAFKAKSEGARFDSAADHDGAVNYS